MLFAIIWPPKKLNVKNPNILQTHQLSVNMQTMLNDNILHRCFTMKQTQYTRPHYHEFIFNYC